ncbi:TadE/TadG family type IV pilus assembly protein [Streptomyces sp. MZ04]|uniref:TadE/TadG family type IV pilus assembly protein n=1 Tax=Streptomyces sp. MZ04 TaxID=2559236 RepID=UPI00107EBFAF|nr:TadE/TadG family type IV pilus assembly protein [Streptomyces sp. MZ04]TGB15519.1 pilus assembly protein [Streptomyces sp. MZ04]
MNVIIQRLRQDRGSLSLEAMILLPVLLLVLLLIIAFGRISSSGNAVDTAARNAARAASLERTAGSARTAGEGVARQVLSEQGLSCTGTSVAVSTAGFAAELGEPASTTVTVQCTVRLSDIGLPGIPGSKTLKSDFTSPIDSYRQRG